MAADDRTYIRLHDGMPGHPKVRGLSDKAFRTLIRAWCYCSEYLTDGEIVTAVARDLGPAKAWNELVEAGVAESAPKGYLMHDYLAHQRSAAEVAEIKAGRGAGGTLGNHVRWHVQRRQNDPKCEHCNPVDPIAPRSQERWDSDSDGISQGDRSRSHSHKQSHKQLQENSSRGGSHVSSGPVEQPPSLPRRCPDHQYDVVAPKCGACKDARIYAEAQEANRPRLSLVAADEVFNRPSWCGRCDEFTRQMFDEDADVVSQCKSCHPLAVKEAS